MLICLVTLCRSRRIIRRVANYVRPQVRTSCNSDESMRDLRELSPNVGPGKAVVNTSNLGENRGMEKYIVTLTAEEREQLEAIVSKGSHRAQQVVNALILLNCDTSSGRSRRSGQKVAAVLYVSERKIDPVKKRFVEEGCEAALVRPPRRCCKKRSRQGVTFTRNGREAASVNLVRNCVDSRYLAGRCARTNARVASLKGSIESGTGRSTTQG
jgi:hypothetical protein